MRERIDVLNKLGNNKGGVGFTFPSTLHVSGLDSIKTWYGRECRNFGLLFAYLLRGIVPDDYAHLKAWDLTGTLFFLMYTPLVNAGIIKATKAVAIEEQRAVLDSFPQGDGTERCQNNVHVPLHFHEQMSRFGKPSNTDTEHGEKVQHEVARIEVHAAASNIEYVVRRAENVQDPAGDALRGAG